MEKWHNWPYLVDDHWPEEVVPRSVYDAVVKERDRLESMLKYAASTGDECAVEMMRLKEAITADTSRKTPEA